MSFEAEYLNGKLWTGRWEQPKPEVCQRTHKFHLGEKKTLLWVSAAKDHWLMLSRAAITYSRPAAYRDCKPLPAHWRTMSRDVTGCKTHIPCVVPVRPHHLSSHPLALPHLSDGSVLMPAGFSSSPIQTPPGLCIQLHIPWLLPQQQESKPRLPSPDEVLYQNPGAGDRGMEEKGCPFSSAPLTPSHGSFRLLQTLWSQLCQLWSLQTKIQNPRTFKNETKSALSTRIFTGG